MSLLLKNPQVFLNGELQKADILIEGERIKQIGQNLETDQNTQIEDIEGKIVLPGLIDAHVHFREPGHAHKEDFLSGSKAAAAGGVTTILDMPNTNPPVISQQDIENKKNLATKSIVNYGFYIGATSENIDFLNNIKDCVGIKVYLGSSTGNLLVDKISDLARLLENTNKKQFSKCAWTPFHGRELKGWPIMTIVNGNLVFKNNKVFEDKKGLLVELGE